MTSKLKPGESQPAVDAVQDARIADEAGRNEWSKGEEAYPGGGVNGPVKQDRSDYQSHYGEAHYVKGKTPARDEDGRAPPRSDQTVHGGQQGVLNSASSTAAKESEGHAGSRATVPGPGADKGPKGPS